MSDQVNVISNADASMLSGLERLCTRAGGRHEVHPQPDGRFTVVCTLPPTAAADEAAAAPEPPRAAAIRAPIPVPRPAGAGPAVRIVITDSDLDALQRVATSEVGHFGKYGEDQLRGGVCAVVDTILNRVAHPGHPDTIAGVVDRPAQFSAINKLGTWSKLPPAPSAIAEMVAEHLRARAAGRASEIAGATHFLNPHLSSASALASWGSFVVKNAVRVYGDDARRDVHFHGFPPGGTRPAPCIVAFAGQEARFGPDGQAATGSVPNATLRRRIVEICRAELAQFRNGKATEADDPQFLRVGEYWKVLGSANTGRTVGSDGSRPAWSAAFVSFVLSEAGAGERFPYAPAHWSYFQHFVERPGSGFYEARLVSDATPQPGDILHHGRGSAERFDFEAARRAAGDDTFYPSHSEIVVAVDPAAGTVTTVGGNVGNSVKQKTFALGPDGLLTERRERGRTLPWIGLLQLA